MCFNFSEANSEARMEAVYFHDVTRVFSDPAMDVLSDSSSYLASPTRVLSTVRESVFSRFEFVNSSSLSSLSPAHPLQSQDHYYRDNKSADHYIYIDTADSFLHDQELDKNATRMAMLEHDSEETQKNIVRNQLFPPRRTLVGPLLYLRQTIQPCDLSPWQQRALSKSTENDTMEMSDWLTTVTLTFNSSHFVSVC